VAGGFEIQPSRGTVAGAARRCMAAWENAGGAIEMVEGDVMARRGVRPWSRVTRRLAGVKRGGLRLSPATGRGQTGAGWPGSAAPHLRHAAIRRQRVDGLVRGESSQRAAGRRVGGRPAHGVGR